MNRCSLCLALILATVTSSACAPYFVPYAGGYPSYPPPRRVPVPMVDPEAAARGRWDSVMRLPTGAIIDVLTFDGAAHVGQMARATGDTVRVVISGIEEPIARVDVVRIDLIDLPGSETAAVARRAAGGALLGIAAVALAGGVIGGQAWPPPAPLVRAGAAIGGVSGAQGALASRRGRLIYLAEDQRPSRPRSMRHHNADREPQLNPWRSILPAPPHDFPATASAPLIRIGLPTLSFGGAQPQILRFQLAPIQMMPLRAGGPSTLLGQPPTVPAPERHGPAICHSQGVPLRRR